MQRRLEQSGKGAGRPRLWTADFVSVLVAQLCFGYAFSSFFLLPKFLATELGAGPDVVGLLQGTGGLSSVVLLLACGVLVDRYGRRHFLTAGGLLMAAASAAFVAVDSMGPLIFVLRALQGMAFAMTFTAGAALAVDRAPTSRLSEAIGIFGLTMLSMNAVAPALVETVAARWGWPWAFGSAALGGALCTLLSLRIHEPAPAQVPSGAGLWTVATRPAQLRVSFVIAMVGTAFGAMFVFHQLFALELGFSKLRIFFVAYTAAAVSARLGLGGAVDRLGRRRAAAASLCLYAACAFAMTRLAWLGLAPLGALLGLAHGVFYPAYNAVAVEDSDPAERGKRLALFQAFFQVGNGGGTLLLGLLADAAGFPLVFVVAGAGLLLSLPLVVLRPR